MHKVNSSDIHIAKSILQQKAQQDKRYNAMCNRLIKQYLKHQPNGQIQIRKCPDGETHISYTSFENHHRSVDFYDFHEEKTLKELEKKLTAHFKNPSAFVDDLFYHQ